jgi:sigma-E factor negative regulatory protein RseB
MRRFSILLLLSGVAVGPAYAYDAESWLDRMSKADQQGYVGTFVYEKSDGFSTYRVWHQSDGLHTAEKLLQLDGPAVEALVAEGALKCASAGFTAIPNTASSIDKRLDIELIKQSYRIRVLGESRVAGRPAQAIGVLPKDQHRYGVEVHIDEVTGVPLKVLLVSDDGQLLERFQYTHLQEGNPDPHDMKPAKGCIEHSASYAGESITGNWSLAWLPSGFSRQPVSQRDTQVEVSRYSDGLARFSTFVEPVSDPSAADMRTQVGPTSVVSKRVALAGTDYMVTVVGEIPLGTAERVALSMSRSETEAAR